MPNTESIISTYQPERRNTLRRNIARLGVGLLATGAAFGINARFDNDRAVNPDRGNPPISAEMKDALTNNSMYADAHKAETPKPTIHAHVEAGSNITKEVRELSQEGYIEPEHISQTIEDVKEANGGSEVQAGQGLEIPVDHQRPEQPQNG